MPVKRIKESQIPTRSRKSESRFEKTPEWVTLKKIIDGGLSVGEAVQCTLSPEQKKQYKITNRRTVARYVKSYIEEQGLKYGVKSFNRDGLDYVVVQHTPVVRQIA